MVGQESLFTLGPSNAMVRMLGASGPRVLTYQLDSKKELEKALKVRAHPAATEADVIEAGGAGGTGGGGLADVKDGSGQAAQYSRNGWKRAAAPARSSFTLGFVPTPRHPTQCNHPPNPNTRHPTRHPTSIPPPSHRHPTATKPTATSVPPPPRAVRVRGAHHGADQGGGGAHAVLHHQGEPPQAGGRARWAGPPLGLRCLHSCHAACACVFGLVLLALLKWLGA